MLYVIKERNSNRVLFHRSEDTIEEVLQWLADCSPNEMTRLMEVNDLDGRLYSELKMNYSAFNIRNDWYTVKNTHGWQWLFDQMIGRSSCRDWEAMKSLFKD